MLVSVPKAKTARGRSSQRYTAGKNSIRLPRGGGNPGLGSSEQGEGQVGRSWGFPRGTHVPAVSAGGWNFSRWEGDERAARQREPQERGASQAREASGGWPAGLLGGHSGTARRQGGAGIRLEIDTGEKRARESRELASRGGPVRGEEGWPGQGRAGLEATEAESPRTLQGRIARPQDRQSQGEAGEVPRPCPGRRRSRG